MSMPKEIVKVELRVPELGTITGLCFDKTISQYLGVPYGVVPGRFRRPQPAAVPWPGNKWDGTKVSPFPCQPPRDFYPIPNPERPWVPPPSPPMSSTNCLSLNISVPAPPPIGKTISGKGGYPVMVFFHGGAFVYAAGGAPIYDGRMLSTISATLGIPTIIISVNFRLGVYGFLASQEIRDYNADFGEPGVGNYGLWDQVEALRWVQRHIAGFGGDPYRVTCFGQSAGGVSTNVHLLRGEKLFNSAIIQSGLLPLCGVLSVEQYQVIYDKLLDYLGIPKNLSPRERLQKLIETPEDVLTAAMVPVFVTPVITVSPCDDEVLINAPMPKYADYERFSQQVPNWCQRIMIGDVANECVIWNKGFRELDAPTLVNRIRTFLQDDAKADKLMSLYGIHDKMNRTGTFYKIEKFTTDGLYHAVDWLALKSFPKMYAYRFDVPSPFDNDWGGLAHHSLDNVYIWSLLDKHLPPKHHAVSAQMSAAFLKFANGLEPWERFDAEGRLMVFDEDGGRLKSVQEDGARGYDRWEEIEKAGLINDFHDLADELCMRHEEMCDPTAPPRAMEVKSFDELGIKTRIRKVDRR